MRRWTWALLDATGLRTAISISREPGYMVHEAKTNLGGLYLCCLELLTAKCEGRGVPDIHWGQRKKVAGRAHF
jgi:hypothetical protein